METDLTPKLEAAPDSPDVAGCPAPICSPPKRRRRESIEAYQNRVDSWKIDQAAKRTGMKGVKQARNRKWRVAELDRKLSIDENEIW